MSFFKQTEIFSMSPREVQEIVENGGQAVSYIAGNKTEAIQALTQRIIDSCKGIVMVDSSGRVASGIFKGIKDYSKGDLICTSLCVTSCILESSAGVLVWASFPGKICVISSLKSVSYGCIKIRDLCAAEPNNPLC
jgi:hypothetical protein